ncbi:MAG: restriction endonuclease [Chloroflexota bacterium]|nr:restriction endonuclease [Dehalococcoidia bacterium]MDW8252703.1 restriction endonuclease [Chloroflexota bacterium]
MIPTYEAMLLPFLRLLEDGNDHTFAEVLEYLARHFALTPAERAALLSSGKERRFDYQVRWARTHLSKALLLEAPTRGVYRITERGRAVLRENPGRIDFAFLNQFPEYRKFRRSTSKNRPHAVIRDRAAALPPLEESPEEALARSYQALREARIAEIVERLQEVSSARFEQILVDLLLALGYRGSRSESGRAIGRSNDGGVDGVIDEDRLGLDTISVQAKRWQGAVPVDAVRSFAGALMAHRATKGIFITTSDFTKEARSYVDKIDKRIALIDGKQLAGLMFDHDVGMIGTARYVVKKLDPNDFAAG